jgi:hypothetical protein
LRDVVPMILEHFGVAAGPVGSGFPRSRAPHQR